MKEFECPDPTVTVHRGGIDAFLAAFGVYRSRGEKVVLRHLGITELDPRPDAVYSVALYLGAMKELQDQFGTAFLHKVGTFIFENDVRPPGLDSVEAAMAVTNERYYSNHQNAEGKIGGYYWTKTGERTGHLVCDNPYPCAFDHGLIASTCKLISATANVSHDETGPCRHKGGERCTYVVEW